MDIRKLALLVLCDVDTKEAYANIALANAIKRNKLSAQDRRFLTELVYGTIKTQGTIDWILARYINRPLTKIPPVIHNILRLGAYQLLFLTKVPASAACNQAVELSKEFGHIGTAKFVNAILRAIIRHPEKATLPSKELDLLQYLALTYYHPLWLVERWLSRLGLEATEQLLAANNNSPVLTLRTNTLRIDRSELLCMLRNQGVVCNPSLMVPEGIVCDDIPGLTALTPLHEGLAQIQDESSMLVAHVVDPKPGEFIIDACGAPGGKTTHLATLMGDIGKVVCADVFAHKLNLVRQNVARLGLKSVQDLQIDARELPGLFSGQADRILVDAPCSGLGVLRRKPDSRWRKTVKQLQELPILQAELLDNAALCLKVGGILVYSTCTTEPEENQLCIASFLERHPNFVLESAGAMLPIPRAEALVQLWPHLDHVDGFFIARLRKQSEL